jgi:hypothetical protein
MDGALVGVGYSFFLRWEKLSFHKKKSYRFPPPHIATIVQFDYISITFSHLKFTNGLLHN